MPTFDVLSPAELRRLDAAIGDLPDHRLRDKAVCVMLRAGMRPGDLLTVRRSGFEPGDAAYPAQLTYRTETGRECVIFSPAAGGVISAHLRTHTHLQIFPGMTMKRVLSALDERCHAAGMDPVSHVTLHNSARRTLLRQGAV